MTTRRSALGGSGMDPLAFLGGPAPDPPVEPVGIVDLAGVGAQRVELALERGRDVDPGVGSIGPEQVEPADPVRRQAGSGERREGHRVARGRIDGVDGGHAGRPVVRVVDPAALVEEGVRVGGEDRVGAEGPDLAHELLAQGQVVGQRPIRLVEERDAGVADDRRGRTLLGLAQGGQDERVGVGVLAALVAARAADQPAPASRRRSSARRSRRARIRHRPDGPR